MKRIISLILVLVLASTANGVQYLTVDGEDVNSITLEVGQSCIIAVESNDYSEYLEYVGFDDCNSLGNFYYVEAKPAAGGCAEVSEVNQLDFCGYEVIADCWAYPGVHFVFVYVAQEVGQTNLELYDLPLESRIEIDSLHITVLPANAGTAFTYQGRLIDGERPANGAYDFEFKLYDAPRASNQKGKTVNIDDNDVENGIFTVELDFAEGDPNVFNGDARWLEIAVRPGDSNDPNDFATLSPRQEITPTPYAICAQGAKFALTAKFSFTAALAGFAGNSDNSDKVDNYHAGNSAEQVAVSNGILCTSLNADKLDGYDSSAFAPASILPSGVIVMWSGSIGSIPSGWALCNGSNGTPNLRDRFIVGAGSSYGVGSTGGEATHTLSTAEMPAHTHSAGSLVANSAGAHTHSYTKPSPTEQFEDWEKGNEATRYGVGANTGSSGAHTHTISGVSGSAGSGGAHENRPPYYALAYIMKL